MLCDTPEPARCAQYIAMGQGPVKIMMIPVRFSGNGKSF